MKRIVVCLVILVMLLTGCSSGEKKPIELPKKADNSGDRVVIYMDEGRLFPISYSVDGKQMLENGTYWYYELSHVPSFDDKETFYIYDADSKQPIEKTTYFELNEKSGYATNGDWELFLRPVHTEYAVSNQEMVDERFVDMTKKQLAANKMEDAEAIVSDVWECDFDNDGTAEHFFKACNCEITVEKRKNTYCFLGYTDGEVCQILYGYYSSESEKAGGKFKKIEPIVCDLNGEGKWTVMVFKQSSYASLIAYDFNDGNFYKTYEIIF